jgi:hypothetical protein
VDAFGPGGASSGSGATPAVDLRPSDHPSTEAATRERSRSRDDPPRSEGKGSATPTAHSACDLGKVPRGGCSFNLRAENRQHNATCANVGTAKQGQIHANTMVGQHLNINSFESELGTWMVLSLKPTLRQNYDMTLRFQYASRVAVCLWSGPGCIGVVKA